jgi:hypothetical protein
MRAVLHNIVPQYTVTLGECAAATLLSYHGPSGLWPRALHCNVLGPEGLSITHKFTLDVYFGLLAIAFLSSFFARAFS